MKEVLVVYSEDYTYSKKFCNQAIKLLGKKYLFLTFSNIKLLKEYVKENEVEGIIISENDKEIIEDIKFKNVYILNEKSKKLVRENKNIYIYKLQNIKAILDIIDKNISKYKTQNFNNVGESKLVVFYNPNYVKEKDEIIKKISKVLSKEKKVLIVNLDEFSNFKGNVGFSNLIFNYKENNLDMEVIKKEIVTEKEQDYIKSVTYPEDFAVINNIDISNIVNEIKRIGYDYVFINSDLSFVKNEYLINDAEKIIILKNKDEDINYKFKNYLKSENIIDISKIYEFDLKKIERAYILAFTKECFLEKND